MSETDKNNQNKIIKYEENARHETEKNMNPTEDQKNEEIANNAINVKYGEIPYRWFFLVSYCLINFVNQLQWVCFPQY